MTSAQLRPEEIRVLRAVDADDLSDEARAETEAATKRLAALGFVQMIERSDGAFGARARPRAGAGGQRSISAQVASSLVGAGFGAGATLKPCGSGAGPRPPAIARTLRNDPRRWFISHHDAEGSRAAPSAGFQT